jgi:hypothetical protein
LSPQALSGNFLGAPSTIPRLPNCPTRAITPVIRQDWTEGQAIIVSRPRDLFDEAVEKLKTVAEGNVALALGEDGGTRCHPARVGSVRYKVFPESTVTPLLVCESDQDKQLFPPKDATAPLSSWPFSPVRGPPKLPVYLFGELAKVPLKVSPWSLTPAQAMLIAFPPPLQVPPYMGLTPLKWWLVVLNFSC